MSRGRTTNQVSTSYGLGNTTKGTPAAQVATDHEIEYPADESSQIGGPSAMTSAPLPTTAAGPIKAHELVDILEGDVGLDAEALTYSSKAAYTVTADGKLHKRLTSKRSDRVWTELTELSLVRTDLATGEPAVALDVEVEDVDFPTKDVYVTALAVNPAWLAEKGE